MEDKIRRRDGSSEDDTLVERRTVEIEEGSGLIYWRPKGFWFVFLHGKINIDGQ